MSKVSESQKRASKKWEENNRDKKRYINHRARARSFVRDVATMDDLDEFEQIMKERRKQLNEQS